MGDGWWWWGGWGGGGQGGKEGGPAFEREDEGRGGAGFRTGRWELDLQAVIPEAPCSHESKMAIKHAGWL